MRFSLLRPLVSAGRSNYFDAPAAGTRSPLRILALILMLSGGAFAVQRPIPDDVDIQAFARPAGQTLRLLVRVPFPALNGIEFPLRGNEGYLDLGPFDSILPGAARYWIANSIEVYENGSQLPRPRVVETRAAIPSDKSFQSYDSALAHLNGPRLPPDTNLVWKQAWLDILFEYPIQSEQSSFSINPKFGHLGARVSTSFKFVTPEGAVRAFTFSGDPGLIKFEPQWNDVAARFFKWGFSQLLDGTDYLLFLFCLVLPFRSVRSVLSLAAAFLLAHSVTLIASTLNQAPDGLWFRPFIETAIAVTILYLALANIAGEVTLYRRAIIAIIFGLFYGFSFAFGLAAKAEYAGVYPVLSTAAFNLGIEAAMLVVLAVTLAALNLLLRFNPSRKIETIVLSVLAAHTAWHWMTERYARLSRFPFHWPAIDAAFLASAMRWMMILVILGGIVWFLSGLVERNREKPA